MGLLGEEEVEEVGLVPEEEEEEEEVWVWPSLLVKCLCCLCFLSRLDSGWISSLLL